MLGEGYIKCYDSRQRQHKSLLGCVWNVFSDTWWLTSSTYTESQSRWWIWFCFVSSKVSANLKFSELFDFVPMSSKVPAIREFSELFDFVPVSSKISAILKIRELFDSVPCLAKSTQALHSASYLILFWIKSPQYLNLENFSILFQCRAKSPQALHLANSLFCTDVAQCSRKP